MTLVLKENYMKKTRRYNVGFFHILMLCSLLSLCTLCLTSCKGNTKVTDDTTEEKPFNGKTGDGEIEGVKFHMVSIAEVKDGQIGYLNAENNNLRSVSLTAYKMLESEVTQELFKAVMGVNPSFYTNTGTKQHNFNGELLDYDTSPDEGEVQEKRPVEHISWYQAIAFCNKLSLLCKREPCYTVTINDKPLDFTTLKFEDIPAVNTPDEENEKEAIIKQWDAVEVDMNKNGFRLPTEAEWEWAAKGGVDDNWAGTSNLDDLKLYAWYIDTDHDLSTSNPPEPKRKLHETKKKKANAYGLYDMSGNCCEWCWDWFTEGQNSTPQGGQDPLGSESGTSRSIRGGCFDDKYDLVTRMFRYMSRPPFKTPDSRPGILGFRFVCR